MENKKHDNLGLDAQEALDVISKVDRNWNPFLLDPSAVGRPTGAEQVRFIGLEPWGRHDSRLRGGINPPARKSQKAQISTHYVYPNFSV